jgi:hypothetical protein
MKQDDISNLIEEAYAMNQAIGEIITKADEVLKTSSDVLIGPFKEIEFKESLRSALTNKFKDKYQVFQRVYSNGENHLHIVKKQNVINPGSYKK